MIEGGKGALLLVLFTVGVAVALGINSFVGLFVGGSLQQAGSSANFTSQIQTGFNTTVTNLIANINAVQTPFSLWNNLLSVILVLAVFAGFVYLGYQSYSHGGGRGGAGDMGY